MSDEPEPTECFECESGIYRNIVEDYQSIGPNGEKYSVPNVSILLCSECGDRILGSEALAKIEEHISEQVEKLSPEALKEIREEHGLDQVHMSRVLGLGDKTYHRWEKGVQYPNRSLGYYLRVLQQFPEAFEWLESRGWKAKDIGSNRVRHRIGDKPYEDCFRFPDLDQKRKSAPEKSSDDQGSRDFNPTKMFNDVSLG